MVKLSERQASSWQAWASYWLAVVRSQGQGRGNCGVVHAAENSRHLSLGNLLASHRGEFADKGRRDSKSPSFPND